MTDETIECRCDGGPWDGRTVAVSAGAVGLRLSAHAEGYDTRDGDDFLGWYERAGDVLRWRGRVAALLPAEGSEPTLGITKGDVINVDGRPMSVEDVQRHAASGSTTLRLRELPPEAP